MAAVLVVASTLLGLLVGAATLQRVAGMNILPCICSLGEGQYMENGPYRLAMEAGCNLTLTQNAQLLWSPWQGGSGVCIAMVEGSGDLVIKDNANNVLWRSHSPIHVNRNYLILDSNGNVMIRTLNDGEVLWSASYPPPGPAPAPPALPGPPSPPALTPTVWAIKTGGAPYMVAGYRLPVGTPLQSGEFSLTLNGSCCLERNLNGAIEWHSETCGSAGDDCSFLLLRENGTLQMLRETGGVAWQSSYGGPASVDSYVLLLETNGDVSVFNSLNLKTAVRVWTGFRGVAAPQAAPLATAPKNGIELWKVVVGIVAGGIAVVAALGVIFWLLAGYGKPQVLSLAEIRQATDDFKTILGEDGFGTVYHGRLDGQDVAVKDLSATSRQGKPEFSNEIKLLSKAHHKYLIPLVGYCLTSEKQILVYEYISGGNLQKRLHGEMASSNPLTWKERTSIILQVAEGIEYLHHGCLPPIIHGDLKSSNVLLTDKMHMIAKVADFGLSKLVGDEQVGTSAYLDPEYSTTENLTEKSDVYAFGVVLMETLTGGPLTDMDGVFIGMRVRQALESGQLEELADSTPGSYDVKQFSELMRLGTRCVKEHGNDRPSMAQVVRELRETGLVQLDPPESMAKPGKERHEVSIETIPPTSTIILPLEMTSVCVCFVGKFLPF